MTASRRAEIAIDWQGVGITDSIAPYLLGLTYTEHLSGAADDLAIDLEDRDGRWLGDWRPALGDTVVARIQSEPWFSSVDELRFGTFAHDEATFGGPPRKLALKATSAALTTGLRRHRKDRAWSRVTLQKIAEDIAGAAHLDLLWSAPDGVSFHRKEQKDQSDLDFLLACCESQGFALKVTDGQIAIFDEHDLEALPSRGTIDLAGGYVKGWSFTDQNHDRYGRCEVTNFDSIKGKAIKGTFRDPDDDGPTLKLKRPVASQAEAETIAKAELRRANCQGVTGKLTLVGDCGLVAGVTFDLTGAESFDGKYIATESHHAPLGGYTVEIAIRRCLEAY